jgi:D-alanine-D-alanine ligase and related ATP-grasp enzymes
MEEGRACSLQGLQPAGLAACRARMRAVVLHEPVPVGAAPDRQDTLVQVAAVSEALTALGYRVENLLFTLETAAIAERLRYWNPALVFNLVEAVEGQGRLIHLAPALIEALRIPCTGCDSRALFMTSDKLLTKRVMAGSGIPTPPWIEPDDLGRGALPALGACIVKSVWEEASLGLDPEAVVLNPMDAAQALEERATRHGGVWFAEAYIEGREFNISLLAGDKGPEVLPISEIRFIDFPPERARIVDYAAKWEPESFAFQHTPRSFEFADEECPLLKRLEHLALKCWHLFGLAGYARVDVRVDERGQPWVLEINANPCLSPDAGFAAAAAGLGLNLTAVVRRIVSACRAPYSGVSSLPSLPGLKPPA